MNNTLDQLAADNIRALTISMVEKAQSGHPVAPEGIGLAFLVLSMIVLGMAFDYFGISTSLFVENEVSPEIRSSAQGLFMMMASGFGFIIGGYGSGYNVDFFTKNNVKEWPRI